MDIFLQKRRRALYFFTAPLPVHFPGTVDSPIAGSFFRCDRLPASGLPLPVRVVYLFRCGGCIAQVQPPTLLPARTPYAAPIRHLYDGDHFNRIQPMNFSAGRPNDLLNL